MIRKIVVPVDGSEASEKILPHLSELFRSADADVQFVYVADWSESDLKRGREYLADLERRVAVRFPYVSTQLLKGEAPAFEIMKHAVVTHADLIAMMTRTRAARLLFGSTAKELLRSSQIPLFLARPGWAARPIRKILVPIDGSRTSQGILPVAGDLALGSGARISLLSMVPHQELRDSAGRELRKVSAALTRRGIDVESILQPGEAVDGILEAAHEEAADVIALGTHGRRGSERFFFGSVAESVIQRAEVPLLVRRRPKTLMRLGARTARSAK